MFVFPFIGRGVVAGVGDDCTASHCLVGNGVVRIEELPKNVQHCDSFSQSEDTIFYILILFQ